MNVNLDYKTVNWDITSCFNAYSLRLHGSKIGSYYMF